MKYYRPPNDWTIDEFCTYEWSSKLCEGYEENTGIIGYLNYDGPITTLIFIDGFRCGGITKGASNRSFVRHFRRKHHKILPYIKIRVFDRINNKVIGVCRISMYKPEYLTGYNENMKLTDDEIKSFIDILSGWRYHNDDIFPDMTNWEYVISRYNRYFNMYGIKYKIPRNLKMPDYTKLMEGET